MIVLYALHFLNNLFVVGRSNLCAVLPVHLVSIVLRGIMTGGHYNPGRTFQSAKRKRKLRRGTQRVEYIRLNTICPKTKRRFVREFRGHISGIISDGHTLGLRTFLYNKIGKPLGCLTNRIQIHAVCAGANNPSQPSGTKLQLFIEPFFDFLLIVADSKQFILGLLVKIIIFQPEIKLVHKAHFASPLFCAVLF